MASPFYPSYLQGTLHPECAELLAQIQACGAPNLTDLSVAQARASFLEPSALGDAPSGVQVLDATAPGRTGAAIPIRIYRPDLVAPGPLLVYFHGGGFVLGGLEAFDPFCAHLAAESASTVLSVDYRLAPEHPHPAALEDAWDALAWVAAQARNLGSDPARLAVAGDSAGGNLAAAVAQMARTAGLDLVLQVLICPWLDLTDGAERAKSFHHFGAGAWLSTASIRWFRNHYLGAAGTPVADPRVSPGLAGALSGLAPALVLTAEFDVLADQGRAYASALERAGVPVQFQQAPGMLHDFVILPGLFGPAQPARQSLSRALRAAFQRG